VPVPRRDRTGTHRRREEEGGWREEERREGRQDMTRVVPMLAVTLGMVFAAVPRPVGADVITALERKEVLDAGPIHRDPFRPPRSASEDSDGNVKSPLERY